MNPEHPPVLKLGGAVLADPDAVASVWADVSATPGAVVVHGGGAQATALARRLGHEPRIVAGRRVTTDLDLDVALYTLRGDLNARLVASATGGVRAVGLCGADGGLVTVRRRPPIEIDGATVDFGHVGDVEAVDVSVLRALLAADFTPVVATVCADDQGALYNVNADTVASEIAAALGGALVLVTEAGGVRRDPSDAGSVIARLGGAEDRPRRRRWLDRGRDAAQAGDGTRGVGAGRAVGAGVRSGRSRWWHRRRAMNHSTFPALKHGRRSAAATYGVPPPQRV